MFCSEFTEPRDDWATAQHGTTGRYQVTGTSPSTIAIMRTNRGESAVATGRIVIRRWEHCNWNRDGTKGGMGCCSVLCRLCVFVACTHLRIYELLYFYDAILFLTSCVAYTCRLRHYAFTIVIKTCLPPVDRHNLYSSRVLTPHSASLV